MATPQIAIIFRETIKPSSPTSPHLRTHHLSLIDHRLAPNLNMPFIFFYRDFQNADINILKRSLSQSLTCYYPLAGRLVAPSVPEIDCNDQGVEFIEASTDTTLDDLVLKGELDESIDQLIPNYKLHNNPNLLEVQLNHFTCGGAAVTVSISHKVGDGFTMANFIYHWATIARGGSPKNPTFVSSKTDNKVPELDSKGTKKIKYATRRFVFPNSKLYELKRKVNGSLNPTRVELLSALIFKSAVDAARTLLGSLQPSSMYQVINMRKKISKGNFLEIAAGNICTIIVVKIADCGEIDLNEVISKLRNEMTQVRVVRSVEEVGELFLNTVASLRGDRSRTYGFSSLCRFPLYEVDFGWGKPVQIMHINGAVNGNLVHLMDTPSGDGIEAVVHLEKEEMDIFQKDEEILAYSIEPKQTRGGEGTTKRQMRAKL